MKYQLPLAKQLLGPCVYVFSQNMEIFYVGSSKLGLRRILGSAHSPAARCLFELSCDLEVITCETIQEARELERDLIGRLNPKLNMVLTRPVPLNSVPSAREAIDELIIKTLDEVGGNKMQAAKKLGIDVKTIYNRLKYRTQHPRI